MPITRTQDGLVDVLDLAMPGGNAIGHDFIVALGRALDEAEASPARSLVLTARGNVFSVGLDVVAAYEYDRAAMGAYVDAFEGLFQRVFTFPKPTVAAVNGHAIAGGCILAMACDLRFMQDGPGAIGVNEVAIGIPFPSAALEIARQALPPKAWVEAILEARRFTPREALALGLLHGIAEDAAVLAVALERARRFDDLPPRALARTKAELRAPVIAAIAARRGERRERFLDAWLGLEARSRIGAVRDALLARKRLPCAGANVVRPVAPTGARSRGNRRGPRLAKWD
jgi:enoyl-CoA hydratase